jgi:hypothetical protein
MNERPGMHKGLRPGTLDAFLPAYDVSEYHELFVNASPPAAYDSLEQVRLSDSRVVAALLRMRGLGASRRALASDIRSRFMVLKDDPGHEAVFGIVGQFWRLRGNLRGIEAADFASFHQPGFAKSAWNFVFTEEAGGTRVSTETRVQCFGAASRLKFRAYWTLIGLFSGLIRMEMLRLMKRRAERQD